MLIFIFLRFCYDNFLWSLHPKLKNGFFISLILFVKQLEHFVSFVIIPWCTEIYCFNPQISCRCRLKFVLCICYFQTWAQSHRQWSHRPCFVTFSPIKMSNLFALIFKCQEGIPTQNYSECPQGNLKREAAVAAILPSHMEGDLLYLHIFLLPSPPSNIF